MFCVSCGSPCASGETYCQSCGPGRGTSATAASTFGSKVVPLSRYPFVKPRHGEVENAARYCNAAVEIEFVGEMKQYSMPKHVRGYYKPPEKAVKYDVPVLLATNKRLLFLQSDDSLLYWSVSLTSKEVLAFEKDEREWRKQHPRSPQRSSFGRGLPRRTVQKYLSPYWVLDPTLNDELDREFKTSVWPHISDLNNLSEQYRQADESPYKFHEAYPGWTWVRGWEEGEKARLLRSSRPCLQFQLERIEAARPMSSVTEHVGSNAPKFAQRIAKFFDQLESHREISHAETVGNARLFLDNPEELADLSAWLRQAQVGQGEFTEVYRVALAAESAEFAAKAQAPSQATAGGSGAAGPGTAATFTKVYSVLIAEWFRSLGKIGFFLLAPIVVLALVGAIIGISNVTREAFPSIPSLISLGIPALAGVLTWRYFAKLQGLWRISATALVLVVLCFLWISLFSLLGLHHAPPRGRPQPRNPHVQKQGR